MLLFLVIWKNAIAKNKITNVLVVTTNNADKASGATNMMKCCCVINVRMNRWTCKREVWNGDLDVAGK